MGTENKKIVSGIVANESELNQLFQESLSGLRDDLNEAQSNVDMYFEAINNLSTTGGKEMYGTLYNDALKIKGQARDRQLKFIDMFKDRVTKKEIINANVKKDNEIQYDHSQLNKMIDEVNQGKKYESAKPIITAAMPIIKQNFISYDDEVEEIDHDLDDEYDEDEE